MIRQNDVYFATGSAVKKPEYFGALVHATEAGGGNLHRGRGATAWGREEGGGDATEAGGGKLHRGQGATAWGREEEEKTEATRRDKGRRGATFTGDGTHSNVDLSELQNAIIKYN